MRRISQREAQRLKARLAALELKERTFTGSFPDGVKLCSLFTNELTVQIVETARRLGHYVVAAPGINNCIHLYGTSTQSRS